MQEEHQTESDSWQQPASPTNSGLPYQPMSQDEVVPEMQPEESAEDVAEQPTEVTDEDTALLRWQAAEYIDHDRTTGWYIALGVVCIILIILAVVLMKSWTFAILVPVMAAALVVYTRRPPAVIDYTLSRKGLYINERLYPYDSFRAFSVSSHNGHNVANLIPRKRFQLAQTIHFPEEVGESLVDMLAARMPMQDAKRDIFDRITSRLRL